MPRHEVGKVMFALDYIIISEKVGSDGPTIGAILDGGRLPLSNMRMR